MNYKIESILLPTDFSDIARNSLDTSIAMCKRHGSSLKLMHVVEHGPVLIAIESGGVPPNLLSEMKAGAERKLRTLVESINTEHGIDVTYTVCSGNVADEICLYATEKKSSLIVVGSHGVSGFREFFIGSTAYQVIKHAPCPVLTVPGFGYWYDFKRILFPIRMIHNALEKYHIVRPIIRMNNSQLLVAGVVEREDPAALIKMQQLIYCVKEMVDEDNVACQSEVHYCEDVGRQVLRLIESEKPDLLVITATLDKSIRTFFVGPYTQQIVNQAKCPVLSIRPELTGKQKVIL